MMRVARAVQNGQVPAGALSKAIYESLLERKIVDGDKLIVIAHLRLRSRTIRW